jgi:hypothetical protein
MPFFTKKIGLLFPYLSLLLHLKPFFTKKISLFFPFLSRLFKYKPFFCKMNILLSFFNSLIMRFLLFFHHIINYPCKTRRPMVLPPSSFLSLFGPSYQMASPSLQSLMETHCRPLNVSNLEYKKVLVQVIFFSFFLSFFFLTLLETVRFQFG